MNKMLKHDLHMISEFFNPGRVMDCTLVNPDYDCADDAQFREAAG